MILYVGIIFWILLASMFCYKSKISCRVRGTQEKKIIYMYPFITMSVYVFFAGMRDSIGDTAAYVIEYETMPDHLSAIFDYIAIGGKEVGFYALRLFIKVMTNGNHYAYFMVVAAISGFAIAYGIQKYSPYMRSSMLLFMLTGTFTWMLHGIRQFMVVAILFCNLDLLIKRDYKKYFLLILALFTFHHSVIIMAPMIFIVTGKPWNKKTMLVLLCSVMVIFTASSFANFMDSALANTSYAGAKDDYAFDDGVNPIRVLVEAVPCIIALVYRKRIERENDPLLNILVNYSVMTVGISLVGMVTSGILMGRLIVFFSVYNLILLPWLVNNLFGTSGPAVRAAMYAIYIVYFQINTGSYYYISEALNLYL